MEIQIKTMTGTSYFFNVDENTTLNDITLYILAKTGIPNYEQLYIHNGKLLTYTQRILDLPNAAQGVVLNMTLSLRED